MEETGSPPEEVIDAPDPAALEAAYESAWADWRDSGEADVWEPATGDGTDVAL